MTYRSELHEYCDEPSEEVADKVIPKLNLDGVREAISLVADEEMERIKEYAGEYISETAARRAETFLNRVLAGDEDAAMALLGNTDASRFRRGGCDDGKPWASMIHGNLFETDGITQRRKIVEAHPELLRNERIADLEAIVEGLKEQVCRLERQLSGYQK